MSAKPTTRYLEERDYDCWNELVAAAPEGSIYSTPEYMDVLCSETDGRFKILAAERGGELVGGVCLYERRSIWGKYVTGRLLLYYNGFVLRPHASKYPSERTSHEIQVLSALEEEIRKNGYGQVQIKNRSPLKDFRIFSERGWKVWPTYTYVVPIDDLKALWERVEQNLRRLVHRSERDGIRCTEDDDFDSFYRLHAQTGYRKGASIYLPEESFRRYFLRLRAQNLCRLYHARTPDGRAISSQLVLAGKHPVTHTVTAATDAEFLKTGTTAFLRWKVFEALSGLGYTENDLTDAQLNPVTHFKSQLGGNLEMSLVLERPDSYPFRLQKSVHKAGSLAKAAARRIVNPWPARSEAKSH